MRNPPCLSLLFVISTVVVFSLGKLSAADKSEEELARLIPKFHQINTWLYRGGQPKDEAFLLLKERGIQRVINLRDEKKRIKKERALVEVQGMDYRSLPWNGYSRISKDQINEFLKLLGETQERIPTLVHCKRGKERTGLAVAAYRVAFENWNPKEAYQEMKQMGFRSFRYGHLKESLYDFSRPYGNWDEKIGFWERLKTKLLFLFYSLRKIIPILKAVPG